jgi:hypothetical protein
MTPLQMVNALFHSCGTSMADLELLDAMVRASVLPERVEWLDTPMSEAASAQAMRAHNSLVKAGAQGVGMRHQLMRAFLSNMLEPELAEQLLQRFVPSAG